MSATPRHRVRLSVHRLLRADEMAAVLREVLSAISGSDAAQAVALGEWGDMLIETAPGAAKPDLQGLGEIAFRLLTGHLPAPGTRYVPGAPPPLATLILHMLGDAAARPTVRDAEMALAVMLGEVVSIDEPLEGVASPDEASDHEHLPFEVVDSFDDEATSESSPRVSASAAPAAPAPRATASTPASLRRSRTCPRPTRSPTCAGSAGRPRRTSRPPHAPRCSRRCAASCPSSGYFRVAFTASSASSRSRFSPRLADSATSTSAVAASRTAATRAGSPSRLSTS